MLHNRFWQGFFALAPLLCIVITIVGYLFFVMAIISHQEQWDSGSGEVPMEIFGGLGVFLLLIFLVVLISLGSLIFYIVHAAQNPSLKQNNLLVVWILLFVFANGLGQLIYWIIEILNKPQSAEKSI